MKKDENPRRLSRGRGQEHPERKPVFDFDEFDVAVLEALQFLKKFPNLSLEQEVTAIEFRTGKVVPAELVISDNPRGGSELRLAVANMELFDSAEIEPLQDGQQRLLGSRQVRFVRRARHGKKTPAIGSRTPYGGPVMTGGRPPEWRLAVSSPGLTPKGRQKLSS